MSSSNEVRLAYIAESTYNETPPAGDFREARFTSETLTGTPLVVESPELRSDRQSSGQTNTGLEVNGDINFVLSADPFHVDMHEAALMDNWSARSETSDDMTIDNVAGTIVTTADLSATFPAGTIANLSLFANVENNTVIFIVSNVANLITFIGPDNMVDEVGVGTAISVEASAKIGTTKFGFSFEKQFMDLTNKSIDYTGTRIGGMSLSFAFGENITGVYSIGASGWDSPDLPITDGRAVIPAGDAQVLNAASNMGWVILDGGEIAFCIESLGLELNNNLQPQNCIGSLTPNDQVPFKAALSITLTAFLADANFDFIKKKITQEPVSIIFFTQDSEGNGFTYNIPSIQLSFPDPAAGGQNSHVMMDMAGVAKYDDILMNTIEVYKF